MTTIKRFDGDNFFLSNFYPSPINIDGFVYKTGEHAFQAQKHLVMLSAFPKDHASYCYAVQSVATPAKAKYLGRSVRIDLQKWDNIKVASMRKVVKAKFDQNPELKDKLLQTDGMLVEGNDWGDVFWGRVDGKGENMLGCILMEVRGYYILAEQ